MSDRSNKRVQQSSEGGVNSGGQNKQQQQQRPPVANVARAPKEKQPIVPTLPIPPVQFVLNTKEGVEICTADVQENDNAKQETTVKRSAFLQIDQVCERVVYSDDGKFLVNCFKKHIDVINSETGELVRRLEGENGVSKAHMSPQNTFLVTLAKYVPNDPKGGNLAVWRLFDSVTPQQEEEEEKVEDQPVTEEPVSEPSSDQQETRSNDKNAAIVRFVHKPTTDEYWPIVQWNTNESICCVLPQAGQLLFMKGHTMERDIGHNMNKKFDVSHFSLSSRNTLAVYCKNEAGGDNQQKRSQQHPSQVHIFRYPYVSKPQSTITFQKADDVVMKWNRIGSALLVHTTMQLDTSNTNYYGENRLYFMRSNGSYTCDVQLKKEGPILDVGWSPKGNEFIVVYGFTPAKATLFNESTQEIFDFGTGARNRVSWSPNGRIVCLCGFGALQGDMEFWDRDKKRKIGQANAKEASVHGWSPCSRFFLTATITPTLRVSNKYQLWKYNGLPLEEKPFPTLYQASWRPIRDESEEATAISSARIPSPRGISEGKSLMTQKKEVEVKKAYVPPFMRNSAGSGGGFQPLSEDMDRSVYRREGEEAPSRPSTISPQPRRNAPQLVGAQKLELQTQQHYVPGFHVPIGGNKSPQLGGDAQKKKRKRKKKPSANKTPGEEEADEQGDEQQ
jgi:translation initiation factor 2A